jgi:8-oxo-dGTP pyrophosphatase MutT (NUDIX family)
MIKQRKIEKKQIHESSAGVIPILFRKSNAQFLVVQHRAGHWGFPKGHIEKGEGVKDAARRELREETGIRHIVLKHSSYIATYSLKRRGVVYFKKVTYFLCVAQKSHVSLQKSELRAFRWLPYEKAYRRLTHLGSRRALAVLAGQHGIGSRPARTLHKERSRDQRTLHRGRRN